MSNFGLSRSQLVKGLVSNISKEILHLNLDKLIHIHQIRLTELEPVLLDLVDEGKIALRPAVELSYLNDIEQQDLIPIMEQADATPSHAQAIKLRKFSEEGKLTPEVIESIMTEEKPNQKAKINLK